MSNEEQILEILGKMSVSMDAVEKKIDSMEKKLDSVEEKLSHVVDEQVRIAESQTTIKDICLKLEERYHENALDICKLKKASGQY